MNTLSIIAEIRSDIQEIEDNATIYEETNFDCRANAIDFIDFHIIDRIEGLQQQVDLKEDLDILLQHAGKVKSELERIDAALFKQLQENIQKGIYTTSSFNEMIRKYLGSHVFDIRQQIKPDYDNLDIFINGLLFGQAIPETIKPMEPEMVFYQKTPARVIFEMAELAKLSPDDVFFDLGSGLGQVAILVNLISGATAIGVEYEPAYCNYAKACTSQLNLSHVEFINVDARKADYSRGTTFFMYTPFEGLMLQDMLDILQKESRKRTIRIFSYGPCSPHVARQDWLKCVYGEVDDSYKLCEFAPA